MGPTAAAAWAHVHAVLLAHRCRPATVQGYRYTLNDFWTWLPVPLAAATRQLLDRYLARPAHPHSPARGRHLSSATQRVYGGQVMIAYAILARDGLLARNPLAGWVPPRVGEPPARSLDVAVVRAAAARAVDPRRRAMVLLAYGAGLRAGEIARLRIEDVDLGEHPHVRVDGKGGHLGVVKLTAELEGFLRGYLAGRPGTGPVCESRRRPGGHLTSNTVSTELGLSLREVDVDAAGHAYRHTCATELLRAGRGRNIHAVQGVLRHKRLSSTQRYVLAYDADAEEALDDLPPVLAPASAAPGVSAHPEGHFTPGGTPGMRPENTQARRRALAAGVIQVCDRLAELVAEAVLLDSPPAPDDVVEVRPVLARWAAEIEASAGSKHWTRP